MMDSNFVFTEGNKRKNIDGVDSKITEKLINTASKEEVQKPIQPETISSSQEKEVIRISRCNMPAVDPNAKFVITDTIQKAIAFSKKLESEASEIPIYTESKNGKVGTMRLSLSPRNSIKQQPKTEIVDKPD